MKTKANMASVENEPGAMDVVDGVATHATATCEDAMNLTSEEENELHVEATGPLAIVFDIDGTLVTDDGPSDTATVRPYAFDMLQWCKARGHRMALFSAAGEERVSYMKGALCVRVSGEHRCSMSCQRVFDFSWAGDKLCGLENPRFGFGGDGGSRCGWCGYTQCERCIGCNGNGFSGYCPCRRMKKLQKVWSSSHRRNLGYSRERTIMLENTPQQCVLNYGNAFYVRTYEMSSDPAKDRDLLAFQHLLGKLEHVPDVRKFRKCACPSPAVGFHACDRQTWWLSEGQ